VALSGPQIAHRTLVNVNLSRGDLDLISALVGVESKTNVQEMLEHLTSALLPCSFVLNREELDGCFGLASIFCIRKAGEALPGLLR
jgi:hypothetical protein